MPSSLMLRIHRRVPEAFLEGVSSGWFLGPEVILGMTRDPQFDPMSCSVSAASSSRS